MGESSSGERDLYRLVEREFHFIHRMARRVSRNSDGAEDLAQETILRALSSAHTFQPGSNVRAWLTTIMQREHWRGRASAAGRAEHCSLDDMHQEPASAPAQPAAAELSQTQTTISALPAFRRDAITMIALEGRSYAEAARTLRVSIAALRCELSRGREQLRLARADPRAATFARPPRRPSYADPRAAAFARPPQRPSYVQAAAE